MGYALNERAISYIDARVAGMKPIAARKHAGYNAAYTEIEHNPEVQAEIRRRKAAKKKKESEEKELTIKWLLEKLRVVVEQAELDEDRPNMLKALDMIGKHLGAWERDNAQKAPLVVIGTVNVQARLAEAEVKRGALIEQHPEVLASPEPEPVTLENE